MRGLLPATAASAAAVRCRIRGSKAQRHSPETEALIPVSGKCRARLQRGAVLERYDTEAHRLHIRRVLRADDDDGAGVRQPDVLHLERRLHRLGQRCVLLLLVCAWSMSSVQTKRYFDSQGSLMVSAHMHVHHHHIFGFSPRCYVHGSG